MNACDICGAKHYARGYCYRHYMQWFRTGTILNVNPPTLAERITSRLGAPDANGCIPWLGAHFSTGYAQVKANGKTRAAHAVLWELAGNARPTRAAQLHHVCDHKWCVNVAHLEQITPAEHSAHHREKTTAARWGR